MKKLIVNLLFLMAIPLGIVAAGCSEPPVSNWSNAPRHYSCVTEQQKNRMREETEWCHGNTGYNRMYCYGNALINHCTKRVKIEDPHRSPEE